MAKISGLYSVLITPFLDNDELDEEGFRQSIRFQIDSGVDGIVVLGTTGETPTLSDEEKERIIRIAVAETRRKVPLMVGTGSYSTKKTIEGTLQAQKLGADQALIVTPYYNKPTQEGIYQHFKAVADAVNIPIMVYNVSCRSVVNIQTDTLKRLAALPNIAGVKEASGSLSQIGDVIEQIARHRNDFSVMSGDDALTFGLMALGGDGVLSVVSNIMPKQVKLLVNALTRGDYDEARELHYKLMPIFRGAFIETNPMPIKAAMDMCGMPSGKCRLPLCDLLPENEQKLKALLNTYGLLKSAKAREPALV